MPVSALALVAVLGCACAFAALDLLRKSLTGHLRPLPLLVWLSAGQLPLFLLWWVLGGARGPESGAYWGSAAASILLNVAANLCYLEAVRRAPLSLTIPLLALSPVFAALLARVLLAELLGARQWLGVLLVVVGVFWLTLRPADGWRATLQAARHHLGGSLLMAVTALFWAAALPFDKLALAVSDASWHGLIVNGGVALVTFGLLLGARRARELRIRRPAGGLLLLAVVVSGIALGLQLVAMELTWVSLVETLKRAVGTLAAVVLGWLVFRERLSRGKLGAAALLAVGVALVLL